MASRKCPTDASIGRIEVWRRGEVTWQAGVEIRPGGQQPGKLVGAGSAGGGWKGSSASEARLRRGLSCGTCYTSAYVWWMRRVSAMLYEPGGCL